MILDVFGRYVPGWMVAALLLADLGIEQSHSRPHVSDDSAHSEAGFKTLKYRPDFPDRFGSLEDARAFCATFFIWYNTVHRHSGIGPLTPADVHAGRAPEITEARAVTLDAAYAAHPERFVRRPPTPPVLPTAVWINPRRQRRRRLSHLHHRVSHRA